MSHRPPTALDVTHLIIYVDISYILWYTHTVLKREKGRKEREKMEFKKERNFINAYDGTTKLGGWNITTGEFVGKSGKVVKSTPSCFTYNNLQYFRTDVLSGAVRMFREYWGNNDHRWYGDYTPARANRFEQMISVGIYPARHDDLDTTITLTKDLVAWIKENYNGQYMNHHVLRFVTVNQYYAQLPDNPPEWIQDVIPDLVENEIPSTFFIPAIRRAINEHWEYLLGNDLYRRNSTLSNIFKDYYKCSMAMYGKVNVEPNMLTAVCKIRKLYKDYEDAHYDEILKANNDKPWLYFENNLLTAKPLLTKAEFHDEASRQHNCVESMYMERVRDGITHVVSIRYKNLPEQSYITCEVNNRGQIVQYLTACNNRVTDRGGIEFQRLYAEHLLSSLKG